MNSCQNGVNSREGGNTVRVREEKMVLHLLPRNVSSVGSERCFDRAEVTGSSPVRSTWSQLPGYDLIYPLFAKRSCDLYIVVSITFHYTTVSRFFK